MKKLLLFMIFAVSFGMNAQTIQSVSPNAANVGQTLQVTITGQNTWFYAVSTTSQVSFYNTQAEQLVVNSVNPISETQVVANITIPNSVSPGPFNLEMHDAAFVGNGIVTLANAFNVTTNYNTISGNVGVDINGNGCDASDSHMAGIKIKVNNGTSDSFTFTDAAGDYIIYVPAGNYVVTPLPELPYFLASPVSATINFATQNSLSQTQNFCIAPNGVHNDVNITILPLGPARPGFDATYKLVYKNNGNQTLTGAINLTFDDSRLDFVSATTEPTSQSLNNLNWDYVNLLPFESRNFDFVLNVNSPMETPAVNINDILPFTATVNPVLGDDTPNDNIYIFNQTVVGSYDPNDKAVAEGSQVNIDNAGNYLNYVIRFQNSGTFAAENVVVRDMLSANLDKSTLQIVSASHPYRSSLTGNKLEFFFDNIVLPPESQNEPGSHGYIAFKIKPVNTVAIGTTIENIAGIYFDFNFPIITNPVSTTFTVLANPHFDFDNDILLYPNPVGNSLNIQSQTSVEIASVKIFNQLGQLVKTINNPGNTIAVDDLKTGTYFIKITSDKGTAAKKLIKL